LNLNQYLSDIAGLKEMISELPEDSPAPLMKKIELLARCFDLTGAVSAKYDLLHELKKTERETAYAKAYQVADKPKAQNAELAIEAIRIEEAKLYGLRMLYRNEFTSMREIIHALKMKMNANFADGSIGNRYQGG
jgi:hypothetical protein